MKTFICSTFVLYYLLTDTCAKYTKIKSKPGNIIFKYPDEMSSERKLQECNDREVCNIVHKRFWLPVLVERICRCPNGFECPWSQESDKYSMMLNNRSLLRFCDSQRTKTICTRKTAAVVVDGRINDDYSAMTAKSIKVNCQCPRTHYWKLQKYNFENDGGLFQIFRCEKQVLCDKMDFCGYMRSDTFSVYYRCKCPEGHLCISEDRKLENVNELLYTGPAYKAYCVPWN